MYLQSVCLYVVISFSFFLLTFSRFLSFSLSSIYACLLSQDNVEARNYVDEMCVRHKKWFIDSGTQGTKGHTQVVIPGISESYVNTLDPVEESIPLCTLKSFPYQVSRHFILIVMCFYVFAVLYGLLSFCTSSAL